MPTRSTALLRPLAERRIPRAVEDIAFLLGHCLECAEQLHEDAILTVGMSEATRALVAVIEKATQQATTTQQTVEARLRPATGNGTGAETMHEHADRDHAAKVLAARAAEEGAP